MMLVKGLSASQTGLILTILSEAAPLQGNIPP